VALVSLSLEYAEYGKNLPKGKAKKRWADYLFHNKLNPNYDSNTINIGQLLDLMGKDFTNLQSLINKTGVDVFKHEKLKDIKNGLILPTSYFSTPGLAINSTINRFYSYESGKRYVDESEMASLLMATALGNELE